MNLIEFKERIKNAKENEVIVFINKEDECTSMYINAKLENGSNYEERIAYAREVLDYATPSELFDARFEDFLQKMRLNGKYTFFNDMKSECYIYIDGYDDIVCEYSHR